MKALAGIVLLLAACSSVASNSASDGAAGGQGGAGGQGASAGEGGTGESGGTGGAMGGAGGSAGQCGPGDLDCLCPGGTFECQNNRITCVCPPECTKADQCGANAICDFYDGNCGRNAAGYCRSVASASQRQCDQNRNPVCGCDGKLYDNACAAFVAGVSPNVAPTSDCASPPVLCSDGPSSVSCYPTQYCMVWMTGGSVSASCSAFDASCATPSCGCLSYNAATCNCELLPSGIVRLTCTR